MGRVDMTRNPEHTNIFHEGENNLADGFFNPSFADVLFKLYFKAVNIHINHGLDKYIDNIFLLSLDAVDADDADIVIKSAAFEKIMADVDDGDFVIETSLSDTGDYYINGQDGLIAMTVLGGGGKFDIRHDDARVVAEGDFTTVEKSEDRTRLTLANGSAKVNIHSDDARVRLIK